MANFFSAFSVASLSSIVPNRWSWQHSFPCLILASFNKLLKQCFPWICLTFAFIHLNVKGSPACKCNLSPTQRLLLPKLEWRSSQPVSSIWYHCGHSVDGKGIAGHIDCWHFDPAYDTLKKKETIFCVAYLEFSTVPVWICQVGKTDSISLFPLNKMESYPYRQGTRLVITGSPGNHFHCNFMQKQWLLAKQNYQSPYKSFHF